VDTGEFALVAELRRRFPLVGDDAAVVAPPSGPLLLAADAIVEGVDFVAPYAAADVGWRAVLVNASDIAAMGGRPLHVLVSIAAPAGVDVRGLVDGVAEGVADHGCAVAGGDLSGTTGPLVVSVAITGTVPDGAAVFRSGAGAGDAVFVTGPLGGAVAAGYPTRWHPARVEEGTAARRAGATAMIDISDGLAADHGQLLDASHVGVVLDQVPVAEGATEAQALGGGDEYELLFTLPASAVPPEGSIRIGTITSDESQRPPSVPGWQHRFS
jgi:thiamine-monophosphate kinase